MDKPTKWLRLQVPTALYNEIARKAKADDRELPVFLRRHLEEAFPVPIASEKTTPKVFPSEQMAERNPGLTGVSVHGLPEEKCMFEGADPTVPLMVSCPCGKCSPRC